MLRLAGSSLYETATTCQASLPKALPVRRSFPSARPRHRIAFANRHFATASTSARPPGGVRVGTLFLALSILGIGATSVGLYQYYTSFNTWPPEIRVDLRSALRCKARQDYVSSHKFFREIWTKATSPDLVDKLGTMKVSGLGIAWAEMLEEAARRPDEGGVTDAASEAYAVLTDTFDWTKEHADVPGANAEKVRAVQIAVRLSAMAEGQPQLEGQTEKQLSWAV